MFDSLGRWQVAGAVMRPGDSVHGPRRRTRRAVPLPVSCKGGSDTGDRMARAETCVVGVCCAARSKGSTSQGASQGYTGGVVLCLAALLFRAVPGQPVPHHAGLAAAAMGVGWRAVVTDCEAVSIGTVDLWGWRSLRLSGDGLLPLRYSLRRVRRPMAPGILVKLAKQQNGTPLFLLLA